MSENLVSEAKEELHVSAAAVASYERQKDILLELVNRAMAAHRELPELIGHNPLQMMHDNHLNHINFMTNVFKFNGFEMLVRIVPWVYRAYHAHGFSYDYFPAELSAWKHAVKKTLDTSDAHEINRVYDWLITQHQKMITLSQKEPSFIVQVLPEWKRRKEKFLSLLLDADYDACLKMSEQIVQSEDSLKDFYLQVIQPSLYDIGVLWEAGKISVAEEHLATAIVGRITANIYTKIHRSRKKKGKAIITAAPNEFHEVGSRMVADLLEIDGWDILYLGANTPESELFKLMKKVKPKFLGISVAMPFNLDRTSKIISDMKGDKTMRKIKIMVGGIGFNSFPEIWQTVGADGWAQDGGAAVELANQWAT